MRHIPAYHNLDLNLDISLLLNKKICVYCFTNSTESKKIISFNENDFCKRNGIKIKKLIKYIGLKHENTKVVILTLLGFSMLLNENRLKILSIMFGGYSIFESCLPVLTSPPPPHSAVIHRLCRSAANQKC